MMRRLSPNPGNACPAVRAAGARVKIFPGNLCGPNWSWKLLTITCKAAASVILRNFGDGGRIRSPKDCTYEQLEVIPPEELLQIFELARRSLFFEARFAGACCHSRVGSSSGSGVSCTGRSASGTFRKFTRMRVHVDDLPRIESTSTSSTARYPGRLGMLALPSLQTRQSGRLCPANSPPPSSGIFFRGCLERALRDLEREGATRFPSASVLRKCGGQGASPRPAASSSSASSSSFSSEPAAASISACGSPSSTKRFGTVSTVNSAGSLSGTSCHSSGVETRASGSGRTEYAEHVVRSLAFWL